MERILFNDNWQFKLGEAEPIFRERSKAGIAGGPSDLTIREGNRPAVSELLDAVSGENPGKEVYHLLDVLEPGWEEVTLPHDWTAAQPCLQTEEATYGYRERKEGWYRKKFFAPREWKQQRVSLEAEGIMRNASVWLNGFYLKSHFSGYTGFETDLTDYLRWEEDGQENVLLIRADNRIQEGWWEEGGGIYRNLWLCARPFCHFKRHGVFVYTSELERNKAVITVEGEVENETMMEHGLTVRHEIREESQKIVAEVAEKVSCHPMDKASCKLSVTLENPKLWEAEYPYRYTLISTLTDEKGNLLEKEVTKFGIRSLEYREDGLYWNGQQVEIKGVCEHQDFAVVGAAVTEDILRYKFGVLKAMGINAVRSAHHAASPLLLDLCDELGILVLNENRRFEAAEEGIADLKELVLGARNHPCVFMWCLENEEFITETAAGMRILDRLIKVVRKYDPTRQTTVARQFSRENYGYMTLPDVAGFNYDYDEASKLLEKYPHQPVMATESVSFPSTRGEYQDSPEKGYCASYDNGSYYLKLMKMENENVDLGTLGGALGTMEEGGKLPFSWMHYRYQLPRLGGVFVWTGFDYRGEPFPWYWPTKSSQYGACDRCGFPKDAFYYWKSVWTEEPVVHVLPHWTWPGKEGEVLPLEVYSNCEEVEVFVNGLSLGRKYHQKGAITNYEAVYRPGEVKVVGYCKDEPVVCCQRKTAGAASAVCLKVLYRGTELLLLEADIVDETGNICPWAESILQVEVTDGVLLGMENGDPSEEYEEGTNSKKTFHGKAFLMVRCAEGKGNVKVSVTSPMLVPGAYQQERASGECMGFDNLMVENK